MSQQDSAGMMSTMNQLLDEDILKMLIHYRGLPDLVKDNNPASYDWHVSINDWKSSYD